MTQPLPKLSLSHSITVPDGSIFRMHNTCPYFATSAEVVSSSAGTPNSISIPFKWVLFLCVRWTRCTLFGSLFEFYSSRMWRLAEKLLIAIAKKKKEKPWYYSRTRYFFFFFPPFSRIKKRKKGKEWLDYPSLPASYTRASAPSL